MTIAQAEELIADWLNKGHPYPSNKVHGYHLYLPALIDDLTIEQNPTNFHASRAANSAEWFQSLTQAAWDLARRGILRPGTIEERSSAATPGGYTVTTIGEEWLKDTNKDTFIPSAPHRFADVLAEFRENFGDGFFSRSQEAIRCFQAMAYLGCCAMSGAAAESILLATAIAKDGNEQQVVKTYASASGRKKIRDILVGNARNHTQIQFDKLSDLLIYWRDEAAHGRPSTIDFRQAEIALIQLIKFAAFTKDNWEELTI